MEQVRDAYLDAAFRRESGDLGREQIRSGVLGRMEVILSEPGDGGLSHALDQFFSAFSSLATNPSSATARNAVREQGFLLADQFQGLAAGVDQLRQDTEGRLLAAVERANRLADEVARLNRQITAAEAGGATAGDLRDSRGRALDELATILPIRASERENGSVGVHTAGLSLVDGAHAGTLEVRVSGGVVGIGLEGRPGNLDELGGSTGGMVSLLNVDLPGVKARLDDLAEALVTEVNTLHGTGTNPAGLTGVDFFDPSGTTASSIALSTEVLASAQAISAGTGGASGEYRAGVNDVALALASMRDSDSSILGTSYGEHFRQLASDIGFSVRSSLDLVEVHETLSGQASVRRSSVSGVSTDEELVRLIEFQTAYSAAARVVTVANEMLETLVRM